MKDYKELHIEKLTGLYAAVSSLSRVLTCHFHYMDRCGCVSKCAYYISQYQPTPEAAEELHYTQTRGVYIMLFAATTTSHF